MPQEKQDSNSDSTSSSKSSSEPSSEPKEPIRHLYNKIRKIPKRNLQTEAIEKVLTNHLQDIQSTTSEILLQMDKKKEDFLKRFDKHLMPAASEVLDEMLLEAKEKKDQLEDKLIKQDPANPTDWDEEAESWLELHSKWTDRKALIDRVLKVVANKTKHLINKDIQVIQDYQTQSLAAVSKEDDDFNMLEERLSHVIAEPLKELKNLGSQVEENITIQEASEWIARLHEKRQNYFNDLLMKIDFVMKDAVHLDNTWDLSDFTEIEGEILFMEREFHNISQDFAKLQNEDEAEKQMSLARLEGLLNHMEDIDTSLLPAPLQSRIQTLKSKICLIIDQNS